MRRQIQFNIEHIYTKRFTAPGRISIMRPSFERGYSSAGRALAWHARGPRFDPAYLHHKPKEKDVPGPHRLEA